MKLSERLLVAFVHWFESGGGVWQTTGAVLLIVGLELGDRSLDPHAFVLMAVLTVYSAITQPALAYSNSMSAAKLDLILEHMGTVVEQCAETAASVLALEERHGRMLEALVTHIGLEVAP